MLLHWSMLAIVGVRIYVDNFIDILRNTQGATISSVHKIYDTLLCLYLPIASWIAFIILNKYWFYEVFSVIKQSADQEVCMQSISTWIKLFSFVFYPAAYIHLYIIVNATIHI